MQKNLSTSSQSQLDDADRRAGAAERELARCVSAAVKARNWTDEAREQAGFTSNVSFDVVWAETLAKAKAFEALQRTAPLAWLVTSSKGLVRTAWTTPPGEDQLAVALADGDTVTPLVTRPNAA